MRPSGDVHTPPFLPTLPDGGKGKAELHWREGLLRARQWKVQMEQMEQTAPSHCICAVSVYAW